MIITIRARRTAIVYSGKTTMHARIVIRQQHCDNSERRFDRMNKNNDYTNIGYQRGRNTRPHAREYRNNMYLFSALTRSRRARERDDLIKARISKHVLILPIAVYTSNTYTGYIINAIYVLCKCVIRRISDRKTSVCSVNRTKSHRRRSPATIPTRSQLYNTLANRKPRDCAPAFMRP